MKSSNDNLMIEGMIFCIKTFAISCAAMAVLNFIAANLDKVAVITVL